MSMQRKTPETPKPTPACTLEARSFGILAGLLEKGVEGLGVDSWAS